MKTLSRYGDPGARLPTRSRRHPGLDALRWLGAGCRLALLLSFLLAGCARGEGPGQGSEQPKEPVVQDSAGEGRAQAERVGAEGPPGDTGEAKVPPTTVLPTLPGDSVSSGMAPLQDTATTQEAAAAQDVQRRLDRLEAENDSLRGAVAALLGSQPRAGEASLPAAAGQGLPATSSAAGREPPEAAADSSRLASDILDVDAQDVQNWGLRIAVAVLFLLLTGLFIRIVIWVLDKLAERNAKRRLLFKRIVPIARISFWFVAILFVSMVVLRVNAQGLLAAGAALGVAVGFAAQDILKNIFGGLIVLFDQPFQVGDKISVEGTYGEVVSIGLRSTRIVTPDDNLVSVPNSQVVDGQVANANAGELNCQVVTDLYLPGWVDEARAKRIAFEAAASSKYVFLNKPIVVLVKDEFKETFLTHLKVKAYVLDPRYEFLLMSDVTERARAGFRKAGLLGPMHGVRAYVDLDGLPRPEAEAGRGEAEK